MANGTIKKCVDKMASIELKRLTIIENKLNKILEDNTDTNSLDQLLDQRLKNSLEYIKELQAVTNLMKKD